MKSIVGSSCIRPDSSGLAPIRSPALTTYVSGVSEPSAFVCVAKYSEPPAGTVSGAPVEVQQPTAIPPGVPASRCPWKSLNASSLTVVSFAGFGGFGGLAPGAADPIGTATTARASAAQNSSAFLIFTSPSPPLELPGELDQLGRLSSGHGLARLCL